MKCLDELKNNTVVVSDFYEGIDRPYPTVLLTFSSGIQFHGDYWRVLESGKSKGLSSSFDHNQIYGLPAHINAIEELRAILETQSVIDAELDNDTGDFIFKFTDGLKLHFFNFTAYEVWEIYFPDGSQYFSSDFWVIEK